MQRGKSRRRGDSMVSESMSALISGLPLGVLGVLGGSNEVSMAPAADRDRSNGIFLGLTHCSTLTIIMKVTGGGKPKNTHATLQFESSVTQIALSPEP